MSPSPIIRVWVSHCPGKHRLHGALPSAEDPELSSHALSVGYLSSFLFKSRELVTLSIGARSAGEHRAAVHKTQVSPGMKFST